MPVVEEDLQSIKAFFDGLQNVAMAGDDFDVVIDGLKHVTEVIDFIEFSLKLLFD